jgi:hypothetical protein
VVTSEDVSYPVSRRRDDERRGRQDGEQRIPSLAEVRRQQQELKETGGQLTVGYQVVLLAELNERLNALFPLFQSVGQAAAHEISQYDDRIGEAQDEVRRMQERFGAAAAALTPDELRPRNPQEERWAPERLQNRREVERARRIRRAQVALDTARDRLKQQRVERTAAARRRDEALTAFGVRARRFVELYQRRIAAYLDSLSRSHPDGRTLYSLLSLSDIPLPDWVPKALVPDDLATEPDNPSRELE